LALIAGWLIGSAQIASALICAALMQAVLMRPVHIDGALMGVADILAAILDAACSTLGPSGTFVILSSSLNSSGSLFVPV